MKILIVCSGNPRFNHEFNFKVDRAFIYEQVEMLKKLGTDIDVFLIKGKGMAGYLKNLPLLRSTLKQNRYDIIHAHGGLSAFFANLQFVVPVVVTFHGSDINNKYLNVISSISSFLSKGRIFVSKKLYQKILLKPKKNWSIIPCGVDMDLFYPLDRNAAKKMMGLNIHKKYILFSSSFKNSVKNFPLARVAVKKTKKSIDILEMVNKSREEVTYLMNGCDLFLMASLNEGSPQTIKEAMACNCPIVSTDVGDVKEIIGDTEGCYITTLDPGDVAEKIKLALDFGKRTRGREHIRHLDNRLIAQKIMDFYAGLKGINKR